MGITIDAGKSIAWLCESPDCIAHGQEIMKLKQKELDRYERTAIDEAKAKTINLLFDSLLGAIWDNGPRNLEQMDDAAFAKILDAATMGKDLGRALEQFLTEYSASLKKQVAEGAPPF